MAATCRNYWFVLDENRGPDRIRWKAPPQCRYIKIKMSEASYWYCDEGEFLWNSFFCQHQAAVFNKWVLQPNDHLEVLTKMLFTRSSNGNLRFFDSVYWVGELIKYQSMRHITTTLRCLCFILMISTTLCHHQATMSITISLAYVKWD